MSWILCWFGSSTLSQKDGCSEVHFSIAPYGEPSGCAAVKLQKATTKVATVDRRSCILSMSALWLGGVLVDDLPERED